MKLNYLTKRLSIAGRWMATTLFCVAAIAFFCQGTYFSNIAAINNPAALIVLADVGDQVQGKASEDAGGAKGFIRDTTDRVKGTAKKNAARVDEATDDNGSFAEGKAKRDSARIEQKAEKDSARTQKAVDNTKNAVERTVDGIKDAFNS